MNCKIRKGNEILEIPYYKLEQTCKNLTITYLEDYEVSESERLNRKRDFLMFQKQYKTFSAYFDYVFLKLHYTLENPFLIPDTVLVPEIEEGEGCICYYARPQNNIALTDYQRDELTMPIFLQAKEENIQKESIDDSFSNIHESFINEHGEMISLKGEVQFHNFWAQLWIHSFLMKEKDFCYSYKESLKDCEERIVYDQADLLIRKLHWMRFAQISDERLNVIQFESKEISKKQQEIIEGLKAKGLLLDSLCLDMSEESLKR